MTNRQILASLTNKQLALVMMSKSWYELMLIKFQYDRILLEAWLNEEYTEDGVLAKLLAAYGIYRVFEENDNG